MKRPDKVFVVTVCQSYRLHGCAKKHGEESRGLFGFHDFEHCSECRLVPEGYEFWGENGHKQGSASNREQLVNWIKRTALKQWRMQSGEVMGYRFQLGSRQTYRA